MKKITVVVPVFCPKEDRLLNFLFNIKHLNTISDRCEIIVSEQSHPDSVIVDFLKIYPNITHLRFDLGDVFNKSILINRAYESTVTDYLWVVDADYYTNYEYVIDSIDDFANFTRPHSEVILLNESETTNLIETDYVKITRDSYESSSANGKYSFIVTSDGFTSAGMMNENFKGWGFQDLDFVENRLNTSDISNLNILGFHLHHPPASRNHVNDNKLLYMGVYSHQEKTTSLPQISKMIPAPEAAPPPPPKNNVTEVQDIVIPFHHTHITFYNDSGFPTTSSVELVHIPRTTSVRRGLSGTLGSTQSGMSFVFYYIKYIIDNYADLEGNLMLSTDFFKNNTRIYNSRTKCELIKSSKPPPTGFVNFKWIGPTTKLQEKNLPRGSVGEYEKFNRMYSPDTTKKPNLIYSKIGAFLVSTDSIKSNPIEFYKDIYDRRSRSGDSESLYMLMTLKNIFS